MKRLVVVVLSFFSLLSASVTQAAQGVQTSTITGIVQSADSLSLPGVTVTVTSPVLQGQRTAVTDVNGVYILKGLPTYRFIEAERKRSYLRQLPPGVIAVWKKAWSIRRWRLRTAGRSWRIT